MKDINPTEEIASKQAMRAWDDGNFPKAAFHFKEAADATKDPLHKLVYGGHVEAAVKKSILDCGNDQAVVKLGAALSLCN